MTVVLDAAVRLVRRGAAPWAAAPGAAVVAAVLFLGVSVVVAVACGAARAARIAYSLVAVVPAARLLPDGSEAPGRDGQ